MSAIRTDRPRTAARCVLLWFQRDLRLTDNPALAAALEHRLPLVPVYIDDPDAEAPWAAGAASRAWLHRSLAALGAELRSRGSRLLLRRGPTAAALAELVRETGAVAVHWNRRLEPAALALERRIARTLDHRNELRRSDEGVWADPAALLNAAGTPYRVFTPFWRSLSAQLPQATVLAAPSRIPAPPQWPEGLALDQLRLLPRPRWDLGFDAHWQPGEMGALDRLEDFAETLLPDYRSGRDRPDRHGSSRLSPHLAFGELSVRQVLAALRRVDAGEAAAGFLRELGWREFARYLLYHHPHSAEAPLDGRFARFAWRTPEARAADLAAWQQGRTGIPLIDAGMRELWVTGWMHNRVRMVAASYLVKNLLVPWQTGARWFWDTLVDADLANNTLGWQWVAGCGADAAPYFRVFNPVLQAQRFDPAGAYIRRWVPELAGLPTPQIWAPWTARAGPPPGYPPPIADPASSRLRALAAYRAMKDG